MLKLGTMLEKLLKDNLELKPEALHYYSISLSFYLAVKLYKSQNLIFLWQTVISNFAILNSRPFKRFCDKNL